MSYTIEAATYIDRLYYKPEATKHFFLFSFIKRKCLQVYNILSFEARTEKKICFYTLAIFIAQSINLFTSSICQLNISYYFSQWQIYLLLHTYSEIAGFHLYYDKQNTVLGGSCMYTIKFSKFSWLIKRLWLIDS